MTIILIYIRRLLKTEDSVSNFRQTAPYFIDLITTLSNTEDLRRKSLSRIHINNSNRLLQLLQTECFNQTGSEDFCLKRLSNNFVSLVRLKDFAYEFLQKIRIDKAN